MKSNHKIHLSHFHFGNDRAYIFLNVLFTHISTQCPSTHACTHVVCIHIYAHTYTYLGLYTHVCMWNLVAPWHAVGAYLFRSFLIDCVAALCIPTPITGHSECVHTATVCIISALGAGRAGEWWHSCFNTERNSRNDDLEPLFYLTRGEHHLFL